MKIHIELEVAPDEVPLAAELLAVLRSLTEHVSVRAVAPSPVPSNGSVGAMPPGSAALSPSAIPPAPLPLAPAAAAPPPGDLKSVFVEIIASSAYADHPEQVAQQLESMAWGPSASLPPDQRKSDRAFASFIEAWRQVALDPALAVHGTSAAPFALLLSHMTPPFKDAVRDAVVPAILPHLTLKRPADTPRSEFFAHAEVFAALASIGMMPMQGAINTVTTLIRDPAKRAAAVTVLGKMVELCGFMIADKVKPESLVTLQQVLASVTEDAFKYDVSYITEAMGWAPPPAAGGSGAPAGGGTAGGGSLAGAGGAAWRLQPLTSLASHQEQVFALAMDPAHRQLVTGGRDAFLQVWSEDGQALDRLDLGGKHVVSLDFHPRLNLLLAAGVDRPRAGGEPAAIASPFMLAAFSATQPQGFALKGFVPRDIQAACVRALPETTGFITGETLGAAPVIQYWDLASAASFQSLQPSQAFAGHSDVVFALADVPGPAPTFVSGGKDGCVFLWDMRRGRERVAAFGESPAGGGPPRATAAHITCLHVAEHLLLTGSTDRTVRLWDLRMAGAGASSGVPSLSVVPTQQVVLKLAVLPGTRTAAVSAMPNLHTLDFTDAAAPKLTLLETPWEDGRPPSAYHDIKWNAQGSALFAVGKNCTLDVYARV